MEQEELPLGNPRRDSIIQRIESRCDIKDTGFSINDKPSPCHLWNGPTSGTGRGGGYGRMSLNGQTVATHIVAFTHYYGYVPSKKQIDHLCNNRLCCNPAHLELVSHRTNQQRRSKRIKEMTEKPAYKKEIFVFGSNLAGKHAAGAARHALESHGAVYNQGIGLQGNSYALPTKDEKIQTLSKTRVHSYVLQFIEFAKENPDLEFNVTRIGCGLAGFKDYEIAPMFESAGDNVKLPLSWKNLMQREHPYIDWGDKE